MQLVSCISEKIGFYLPEYYLTPETIFRNEVLAFDVNFFNPRKIEEVVKQRQEKIEAKIPPYVYRTLYGDYVDPNTYKWYIMTNDMYSEFQKQYGFADSTAAYTGKEKELEAWNIISGDEYYLHVDATPIKEREWEHNGKVYRAYYWYYECWYPFGTYAEDWGMNYFYGICDLREVIYLDNYETVESEPKTSLAYILQPTVAAWYVTLRNIALVALLSVLVYIGIRITLSSVSSDKAKYKQMLVDWSVALCLVFLMHYIMSFAVTINEKIIDAVSSITVSSINESDVLGTGTRTEVDTEESEEAIDEYQITGDGAGNQSGVQLFTIEDQGAVSRAYKTLMKQHRK